MDSRKSNSFLPITINRWIKTLSIDYSPMRIKVKDELPYILSLENPKNILRELIILLGLNPKYFLMKFKGKEDGVAAKVAFANGLEISELNKVYIEICKFKKTRLTMKERCIFISDMAHELCHVLLISTSHELSQSEVCTDLLSLILGFDDLYGNLEETFMGYHYSGYLSYEDLSYIRKSVKKYSNVLYL